MAYSPVYSVPLILFTEATPNTEFEVPSGYTAVVRQVSVYVTAGGTAWSVYITGGGLSPGVTLVAGDTGLLINQTQSEQGHWPVPEGYTIHYDQQTLGLGGQAYVGGYLLKNTLP